MTPCTRAYVDNEGDFSYVPYGLDILEEGLVKVCGYQDERAANMLLTPFRVELSRISPVRKQEVGNFSRR